VPEKIVSIRRSHWLLAALLASGCAGLHSPPGPVIPDRPGYTDTPTVLPRGAAQVEAGFTSDQNGGTVYRSAGETLLRVGVGGPFELRLFGNSYATRTVAGAATVSGMEDLKIGAKLALIDKPDSVHGLAPNLALLVASTLATGANGIGAGAAQPEAKLAASWTTSGPFSFYTNAGVGAVYDGTSWSDHGWGSLATWYAASPRLSLFVEGMHVYDANGPVTPASYVDAGATLMFGERFQVDARVGRGAGGAASSERFFGFGFGRRF
jgi:hypothetical protein